MAAIKQITVTGTVLNTGGSAVNGYATFIPSVEIVQKSNNVLLHGLTPLTYTVTNGTFSAPAIWANNDPGLANTTGYWLVTIYDNNHNVIETGAYVVPYTATGASVDISTLATIALPGQSTPAGVYLPPLVGTGTTHGFLGLPIVAGAPTGTPTEGAGCACFDTTNNKIWVYSGTAWKGVAVS